MDRLKPNQDTQVGNPSTAVQGLQKAGNPLTVKGQLAGNPTALGNLVGNPPTVAGNPPTVAGNQQRRKPSEPIKLLGVYQSPESHKSPESSKSPATPKSPESSESPEFPYRRRLQDNVTRIRVGGTEEKTPR